jgi:hypothetical protein
MGINYKVSRGQHERAEMLQEEEEEYLFQNVCLITELK